MFVPLHDVLLCVLLGAAPARDTEIPSTSARAPDVRVTPESALGAVQVCARGGRVEFLGADGRVRRLARDAWFESGGPAHLEAGAGAVVEVAWPELGSLHLVGPCTVEWDAPARTPNRRALAVRIDTLAHAEFELRGAALALELPGGWRVHTSASAFSCRAVNGGRVRLASHAGAALVIDGPRHGPALWPRRALGAGAELTLDAGAPPPARVDQSRSAPPWSRFEWPWCAPRTQDASPEPALAPQEAQSSAVEPVSRATTAPDTTTEPLPARALSPDSPADPR